VWTDKHTAAFIEIKTLLASPATLALYDVTEKTKIRTDGSL